MKRILTLTLLLSVTGGCRAGYRTFELPKAGDTVSGTATGVKISETDIVGTADQQLPSDCELTVKLRTWDGVVESKAVCIKLKGHGLAIPERILLATTGSTTVYAKTYCEGSDYTIATNGCVWNRRFHNNYPMGFTIATANSSQPIGQFASLIRVLRNGRAVFTWNRKEAPQANTVDIPSTVMTAPEYFRSPVDLGLYILESGVEEGTAAAAREYEVVRERWSAALSKAVSSAALSQVPDELKDAYACFSHRLAYLRARAAKTDLEADREKKAIAALAARQGELAKLLPAKKHLRVVTDIGPGKGLSVDNAKLEDGDPVAVLNASGTRARFFRVHANKPWEPTTPSKFGELLEYSDQSGKLWLAGVERGSRSGTTYAFSEDAEDSPARVVGAPIICATPDAALDGLHAKIDAAIKDIKSPDVVKVMKEAKQQVLDYVDKSKEQLESSVAELPVSVRDKVRTGVFWARYVEDVSAAALSSAAELETIAPVLKTTLENALKSPEARLAAYEAFANALPNEDTFWSKPFINPAPAPGEARFAMTFVTPKQVYWFLAWNGVPIAADKRAGVQTEPRIENLIPIVDVVGVHFQTTRTYLPSWGAGIGFFGTRETIDPKNGDEYVTNFNVGPQLNLSLSSFRLGVTYMIREADDCDKDCFWSTKNVRIILGADLVRLFTGKSIAASMSATAGSAADK